MFEKVVLVLCALMMAGCGQGGSTAPPTAPPSRFDAVMAQPQEIEAPDSFCDSYPSAEVASPYVWPTLDTPAPAAAGSWTWINVWATWCVPCLEEMPLLKRWATKLTEEAGPGAVQFLSVDAEAETLATFHLEHPELPQGVRLQSNDLLEPWMDENGLDKTAGLPIHIFLDAQGRIRCSRSGAVGTADYDAIASMIRGF